VVNREDTPDRRAELVRLHVELDRLEASLRDTQSLDACDRRIQELRKRINQCLLWRGVEEDPSRAGAPTDDPRRPSARGDSGTPAARRLVW
jgi:hypothetical protein